MISITFQEKLAEIEKEAKLSHSQLLFDIENKILDMKVNTLEYRSWTTDLYKDFCDGLFFSRFEKCDKDFYRAIAQNFVDLLKRFIGIKWEMISAKKLSPLPIKFNNFPIYIEDNMSTKPFKRNIQTLKREK